MVSSISIKTTSPVLHMFMILETSSIRSVRIKTLAEGLSAMALSSGFKAVDKSMKSFGKKRRQIRTVMAYRMEKIQQRSGKRGGL
jgi:hypothetical protein